MEAPVQFVLPLFDQTAGANHKTALEVPSCNQLPDEQARHDRLAGAGIVSQQESQGLPWQHGVVNRGDLVRQRLNQRRVHCQYRVKEVSQPDAMSFGDQPERGAIAIEAPRPAVFDNLDSRFILPVEQFVGYFAARRLVGQFHGSGAKPLHAHDGNHAVRQDSTDDRVRAEILQCAHLMRIASEYTEAAGRQDPA